MATVELHGTTSQRFIQQAEEELRDGDSLQASEKGWGAAAHAVKAIAENRGWRHNSHADLFEAVLAIANEMGQPRVRELFNSASALHTNFYEGWLSDEFIAANLENVREMLGVLEGAPRRH